MIIVAVDDEKLALKAIIDVLKDTVDNADVYGFIKPLEALEFIKNKGCDIAFLDIKMRGITGLELAKKIKEISPITNIVFVTGYSDYTLEAFKVAASDYLLKPIDSEQINHALDNLRNPVFLKKKKRVRIQCFGNFEVFVDDTPLVFKRTRTKELLAYLVDRNGSFCTMLELMNVLWEDKEADYSKKSNLRNIIADLKGTLSSLGITNVIRKKRSLIAINTSEVECDYFDFLNHEMYAVNKYRGEYMAQYDWAELSSLDK